jgi:hypothetical protein
MKLYCGLKRTARHRGTMGLGVRLHLPTPTIIGVDQVALESELQVDLILWQFRLRYTTAPHRNYEVW